MFILLIMFDLYKSEQFKYKTLAICLIFTFLILLIFTVFVEYVSMAIFLYGKATESKCLRQCFFLPPVGDM